MRNGWGLDGVCKADCVACAQSKQEDRRFLLGGIIKRRERCSVKRYAGRDRD